MNSGLKDHLTVADVIAHGVSDVEAGCRDCSHAWFAAISFLPASLSLAAVEKFMACPACASALIEVKVPRGLADRNL